MIEESSSQKLLHQLQFIQLKLNVSAHCSFLFVYVTTERTFAGELKFAG